MATEDHSIPIVDLGGVGLTNSEDPSEEEWQRVAKAIIDAFKTIGFVYLTNHGIPDEVLNNIFKASEDFFQLPQEEKDKYGKIANVSHGYVAVNREKLDPKNSQELRESYYMTSALLPYPDDSVPAFRSATREYLKVCQDLGKRLLVALALGLGLDRHVFLKGHKYLNEAGNSSCARINHYPPVPSDLPKDTIRCGAHTDYGSITLLFQDDMGGLNVRNRDGQWVNAGSVPGSLLVNIGDLMQLWTSDTLPATEHRVVVPEEEVRQRKSRRSVVYFMQPDDAHIIKPLDGSNKFKPISGLDYLKKKYSETYSY